MMRGLLVILLLTLSLITQAVTAIPVTAPAMAVGNNNVTWIGTGISGGIGWFQWGQYSDRVYDQTKNISTSNGTIIYTQKGTPLFPGTQYYFKVCDMTGCGGVQTFTVLTITPLPSTTYGVYAQEVIDSGFDPVVTAVAFIGPFVAVTGMTIFWGFIIGLIFVGIWLRTRGTIVATQLWMVFAGFACSAGVGLMIGLPPEFTELAQALFYTSLAGSITAYTFK